MRFLSWILPFFWLLVLLFSCKNTGYLRYYNTVNEAHYYFYNQELDTAKLYFEKAFKKVKLPYEKDLFMYSVCLWEGNNKSKAIEILDTNRFAIFGINKGGYIQEISDSLKTCIEQKNSIFIQKKWDRFYSAPLYLKIQEIKKEDQRIRRRIVEYLNIGMNHEDSLAYHFYQDSLRFIDSTNFVKLDSVFLEFGFLGGVNWSSGLNDLHGLMLHAPESWLNKNQKFLFKELKRGHILPVVYGATIDRIFYTLKNEPGYYYQYIGAIIDTSVAPDVIFERQQSIGASPYFIYDDRLVKKGETPKTTKYYEYYKKRKSSFSCIK